MALTRGTRVGRYEILAPLGGGLPDTYRAHDTTRGCDVALRVLPGTVTRDAGRLAALRRELELLSAVSHTGLAAVYGLESGPLVDDAGDPVVALAFELVEGPTLADVMASGAVDDVLRHIGQVASALGEAHERGLAHGGLTADSVRIQEGGAKVVDFCAVAGGAPGRDRSLDARSDVHALGALVYRALTGRVEDPSADAGPLQVPEHVYRVPFQDAPHPGFLFDENTLRFVEVNQAACALYQYSRDEFLRMTVFDIRPEKEIPLFEERVRRLRQLPLSRSQWTHQKKDGTPLSVEISSMVVRVAGRRLVLALVHDLSERMRLEEQFRQAQKMEAIGVLAGGIAHDFNNLLTSVLGYANLAVTEVADDSPVREMLGEIETAAQRGAELTHQMLAYAGRGDFVRQVLRLDSVVKEMSSLLRTVVSRKAVFQLDLHPATIRGDATQIRQVVMNLMTNASDALGGEEGTVTLRTGTRQIDATESFAFQGEPLQQGETAYVEVIDTGCGMSADTIEKIFDPFFTTKFAGRGLGLAAVQGIVRSQGGALRVVSAPGQGSTIEVVLPAVSEAPDEQESHDAADTRPTGTGTVLVVEDEADVRAFVVRVLEEVGFHVLAAADGVQGVDLFGAHRDEIRAVVLDRTMPRMDGWEVARQIHGLQAQVPIIMMSGYSQPAGPAEADAHLLTGFIQKPFRAHELATLVCRIASPDVTR